MNALIPIFASVSSALIIILAPYAERVLERVHSRRRAKRKPPLVVLRSNRTHRIERTVDYLDPYGRF
jgi:hypothetical protein